MPTFGESSSEGVCVISEYVRAKELAHPLCLAAYKDPIRHEDGRVDVDATARKHNIARVTFLMWLIDNKHKEHMKADRT
jgi:hypothetical protein